MKEIKVTVNSRDNHFIDAVLYEADFPKGIIQLCGGAGIKKEFYVNFAAYLCENNYTVAVFDYRGIGGSRPKSLRNFHARAQDWGQKDMVDVLDWLDQRYPGLPKYLIGHSIGGQLVGMMKNHYKIAKAILINSSSGYWRSMSSPYKYFTLFVWLLLVPVFTNIVGYFPASFFGMGEDLPKGVVTEWKNWCLNREYFGKYFDSTITTNCYDEIKIPIVFLFTQDDPIATDKSVHSLMKFYSSAPIKAEKILASEYSLEKLGHFGFFSRKASKLWPKVLVYFENC